MPRRSSLPGADELFRATTPADRAAESRAAPTAAVSTGGTRAETRSTTEDSLADTRSPSRQGDPEARVDTDDSDHASTDARLEHQTTGVANDRRRALAHEGAVGNGLARSASRTEPASGRTGRSGSGVRRVSRARTAAEHQPSGRERHEEKITVYVSPQELLELERARWVLRAEHGLASDRGRIVREAVAVVLADFEAKGADSILVPRLQEG